MWKRIVVMVLLAGHAGMAWCAPMAWPDAPYSYYGKNVSVLDALREFAQGFSLSVSATSELPGNVNGRISARNPAEYLNNLAGIYGFVWFVHGGTLYISKPSETVTRPLSASFGSVGNLRQALTDLGLIDPRFGWGELPDQGVAMVSGPPAYVRILEQTIAALPPVAGGQQIAIFKLKYAPVDDRRVRIGTQDVSTPGVATILRNLITMGGVGLPGPGSELSELGPTLKVIPALGEASVQMASKPPVTPAPATPQRPLITTRATRAPTIQADIRQNAVIVQDVPERIPVYERLIAQLDVPIQLIEIEAMILDVNATRLDELGVSWSGGTGGLSFAGGGGSPISIGLTQASSGSTSSLVVGSNSFLNARITALESVGDARIQSRPSILTLDNTGAIITLSETFYIRTIGDTVATVTPVSAGTTFRVTPHLIDNGHERQIQLTIDIDDGQIQDRLIDSLPTVRSSTVSTQAIVGDNQTLLIGGYTSDQDINQNDRVPVLGTLPGVGVLFSTKTKTVQKRERLFMIRPKLVVLPVNTADSRPADPAVAKPVN